MDDFNDDDLKELDEELSALEPDEDLPDFDNDDEAEKEPEVEQPKIDETAQLRAEIDALKRSQEAEKRAEAEAAERARQEQLKAREEELKARRKEALESDDLDQFDKIDEELSEVRLQRRMTVQVKRPASTAPAAAQEWAEKNPRFFSDSAFHDLALAENAKLLAEGLNPEHPRFYQELDKRLNRTPRMNGDNKQGAPVQRTARHSSGDREAGRQDRGWMEKFGIDSGDKKAQAEWTKSKRIVQQMTRRAG